MFGRSRRTCLPSLPSHNPPIDFTQAAISKDTVHTCSKLSLPPLSPSQRVYLQDSKSFAWDRQCIIVSMRPDRLSYIINVDNRFFTRPRRLLRPVVLESQSPPPAVQAQVSPPLLRRSERLQSCATPAVLQISVLPMTTSSSASWEPGNQSSTKSSALSLKTPRKPTLQPSTTPGPPLVFEDEADLGHKQCVPRITRHRH